MISFLLLFFFSHHIHSAGFAGHTLLLTKHGQTTFDTINGNTLIQSHKNAFQPVLFLGKQSVTNVVQLNIADETITCHKKQLFWCANKDDWVYAKDLLPGDLLQTINEQQIAVAKINIIEQQTELFSLTVGPPHYLYVGKYNVLAHNVAWVIVASASPAVSAGVVEFIKASIFPVLSVIALKMYDCFAKNRDKKKQKMAISVQPVCNAPFPDPNDDKNKYTFKNGIYEDADYHTTTQNGLKSPRPQDGQEALDNSYAFGKEQGGRITIQNGEFVVLRSHGPGKYHGYRCPWKEVPQQAKNILQNLGFTNHKGKIL